MSKWKSTQSVWIPINKHRRAFFQKNRLEELGWLTKEEINVTCCYARQDKFWVQDPDGNGWEFFYTKEDADVYTKVSDSTCYSVDTKNQNNVQVTVPSNSCGCSK